MTDLVPTTGAREWVALEEAGVLKPRSLSLPEGVSEAECTSILGAFRGVQETCYFAQGDLFGYVKDNHGDDALVRVIEAWGLNYHTCENKMSICRHVRPSVRRDELSFGHHDVVRKLSPNNQRHFLALAVRNQWTRQQLRDRIYGEKILPPAVSNHLPDVVRDALEGAREMMDGWLISRDSYMRLHAALNGGEE